MSDLTQIIDGIRYTSPFTVSSSPLTDSVDCIKIAEENGAGAVSTKLTMAVQPSKGVRKMYAERGVYSFNPSDKRNDLEPGLELVRKAAEAVDIPIWTNMAGPGGDIDGWVEMGRQMQQAGASVLELNFTCPNVTAPDPENPNAKFGANVGKDPALVAAIVAGLKKNLDIPVYPKLPGDGDMVVIAKAIEAAGANGAVVTGGTLAAPPIDIFDGGKPKMATMIKHSLGGFVGPVQKRIGMARTVLIANNTKLTVAGGGGVETYADGAEFIMFGSTFVPVCTKLMIDGFTPLKAFNEGLKKFMDEYGYETIADMRGIALRYFTTNDKLEYVNAPAKVDADKCKGCGICTHIPSCTAKLHLEDKLAVLDSDKCIFCGYCASLCPTGAISLTL